MQVVQVLEGPREEVFAILNRIKRDNRHHTVQLTKSEPLTDRMYEAWMDFDISVKELSSVGSVAGADHQTSHSSMHRRPGEDARTLQLEKHAPMQGRVAPFISDKFEALTGYQLELDDELMTSGLNSLGAVRLRHMLQTELELELPQTLLFEHPTLGSLVNGIHDICDANCDRQITSQLDELCWEAPAGDRQLWSVTYNIVLGSDETDLETLIEAARTANQVPRQCMHLHTKL